MLLLRSSNSKKCWICGSSSELSREHKFKASDIRRQFGREAVVIGHESASLNEKKHAQGANSKHLKYESTICSDCNSSVTQESDRAYDKFINLIEAKGSSEAAIQQTLSDPEFAEKSQLFIPLFRYFAKRVGCHLAELNAPIPVHLSRFVAKKNNKNCIWLETRLDPSYQKMSSEFSIPDLKYAAHGGLVVMTKGPKLLPNRVYTTLTVGRIQFIFFYFYTVFEIWEMRVRFPKFVRWCADQAKETIANPIDEATLIRLGLSRE